MLSFNSDKFDFSKISERVSHFYPIGIKKEDHHTYYSYPGIKELDDIIIDNIHNEDNFNTRWESFTQKIQSEAGEIIGTTYGQAPSFSSYVLLSSTSLENLTRTKELHFLVSLVGPFYTIIGLDCNNVKIGDRNYGSENYLVVSPENEFAEIFNLLCSKIENHFTGFQFVPYEVCKDPIDGLEVRYSDDSQNNVFHALFNKQIDLKAGRTIGNGFYKIDSWIKKGYVDNDGWVISPKI